ncbi:MAG: PilZ domain-containing protein [Anaeromyxobacteraceae bacterium]
MPNGNERRRFSRIVFHRPAEVEVRGRHVRGELLDVSLKGALVQVGAGVGLPVGTSCSVSIHLDDGGAIIRMEGEVAHVQGLHVGIRCDEIDLESIGHLRRLVELNLGDDEVLHRELGALVAERDF